jgi:hypothetical protein
MPKTLSLSWTEYSAEVGLVNGPDDVDRNLRSVFLSLRGASPPRRRWPHVVLSTTMTRFLVGDGAGWVNGQTLRVNGGLY